VGDDACWSCYGEEWEERMSKWEDEDATGWVIWYAGRGL
jgi:hypothetical protein